MKLMASARKQLPAPITRIAAALGRIGFATLLLVGLLLVMAVLVRPDLAPAEAVVPSQEDARIVEGLRDWKPTPDDPPVLYRGVDYTQGEKAGWFPKGESPVLAELVAEGTLPPVAERVGPEPLVLEGIEGLGTYGGTWVHLGHSVRETFFMISFRLSGSTLLRWSPQGYPIVPHVAKSYEVSPDNREFTFTLRRGMKWSDGHPFTADDILYFWQHHCLDRAVYSRVPDVFTSRGKPAEFVKIGDHCFKVAFPEPNGMFLARMASNDCVQMMSTPAHYLTAYHPTIGDRALIRREMKARNVSSPKALYSLIRGNDNPEHPRLWPWVYRKYQADPPYAFVRNPYYFAVDPEGNQLPYVDRLLLDIKSSDMIPLATADGAATLQTRSLRYKDYTHLMSRRHGGNYEVLHWSRGGGSEYTFSFNLNRQILPDEPQAQQKRDLLNDRRFRQALSLAINRTEIIKAEYNGRAEPAQPAPGPESPFYEASLYRAFVNYDPERANRLLDEIGLSRRDSGGFRTFPDGSRMTFYLDADTYHGAGPAPLIVDDWADVGVRVILRVRSRRLFDTSLYARKHEIYIEAAHMVDNPILHPRHYVPSGGSAYAYGFARWYLSGGLYGRPEAAGPGAIEPPPGHPLRRTMEVYEEACQYVDVADQARVFREALKIAAENTWTAGICTPPPTLAVRKNGFHNVPDHLAESFEYLSPANAGIETFYFDEPYDSPGAIEEIKASIARVTAPPDSVTGTAAARSQGPWGRWTACVIRWVLVAVLVAAVLMVALKHPYVGRRLVIMVPTLLIVSVITFTIIQLPPGDFLTVHMLRLQESGGEADRQALEDLREIFHVDDPAIVRYLRWMGIYWFGSFDSKDAGLLQGHLGRSMETNRSVNDMIGDRLLLTMAISAATILFTWAVALPIGIYSAVQQYSWGDYIVTFIGFIGMCVPPFLLALLVIYGADVTLGIKVHGLFSPEFGAQPEWNWPKVVDLLKHIWVPIVVLGVGGTASMIRVMRANLLDELRKPYVTTARAKGVRPLRLLLKYPVRIALNPFISGIGHLFPALVSGGAIVAMVLSLPTVGPMLLNALMTEDMYLAGSMLMVLSLLGVLGTLVSDLLLLWLDPRIRFQGATR